MQSARAAFTDEEPHVVIEVRHACALIKARTGTADRHITRGATIDAEPDPPVVGHLAAGGHVDITRAATGPAEEAIAAVACVVIEAAVGYVDRAGSVAAVAAQRGPAILLEDAAIDIERADAAGSADVQLAADKGVAVAALRERSDRARVVADEERVVRMVERAIGHVHRAH